MNTRQLEKLGVPQDCVRSAITAIQNATKGGLRGKQVKETVKDVVSQPDRFVNHEHFGGLAKDIIADREFVRPEPINPGINAEQGQTRPRVRSSHLLCLRR